MFSIRTNNNSLLYIQQKEISMTRENNDWTRPYNYTTKMIFRINFLGCFSSKSLRAFQKLLHSVLSHNSTMVENAPQQRQY
jgi:hypothetical protein